MARGEIHTADIVDDRALQPFCQFNKTRHAGGRARKAVDQNHRVLGLDQPLCQLSNRARIGLRRNDPGVLRDAQLFPDRGSDFSCSSASSERNTGPIGGVIATL